MLVEHHMDLVMSVCDEIVVLDFGRRIAAGSPDDIRDDPAVAEAYLGAEPADADADTDADADADADAVQGADNAEADNAGAGAVVKPEGVR
jgi:branched-chain amino acid transport system ATP-binding protein